MESTTMESASGAQSMQRHARLLIACLVVVWGCNWPINKLVLNHVPPLWFACLRVGTGGLTFFLLQAFADRRIRLPARSDWVVVIQLPASSDNAKAKEKAKAAVKADLAGAVS